MAISRDSGYDPTKQKAAQAAGQRAVVQSRADRAGLADANRDGFHGNTQTVSDGGLFGWSQSRQYDPKAFTLPNADHRIRQADAGVRYAMNRTGPTDTRDGQMALARLLTAGANGQGPSVAQAQLTQATDANVRQAMALGASQRTAGGPGVLRAIGQNAAQVQQQAAGESAVLRLQEQQQAQSQLAQLLGGTRQQDIGQMAQNDDMVKFYTQMGISQEEAVRMAAQRREELGIQYDLGLRGVSANTAESGAKAAGSGIAALGGLATLLSDETKKKDIRPADDDLGEFLENVGAHRYRYKDEEFGKGEFFSPMAQELERAGPVGKSMVVDTPNGKMVHYGRGVGALLSSVASIHKRLKAVEGAGVAHG